MFGMIKKINYHYKGISFYGSSINVLKGIYEVYLAKHQIILVKFTANSYLHFSMPLKNMAWPLLNLSLNRHLYKLLFSTPM